MNRLLLLVVAPLWIGCSLVDPQRDLTGWGASAEPSADATAAQKRPQLGPPLERTRGHQSRAAYATRTTCMRPCAVQLDAQVADGLSWAEVRDNEFTWDFDDGGMVRDAEGFLAAVVYETAGTYQPRVTVNGSVGQPVTVTVREPSRVACVSPKADWTGCPAGAKRFESIAAAMSGTGSNVHILLEGGVHHGPLPSGGRKRNVLFGAYDHADGEPSVTAKDVRAQDGWSYQDLIIEGTGNLFDGFQMGSYVLWHRVKAVSKGRFATWVFDTTDAFVIESDITGGDYALYVGSPTCNRMTIKDSRVTRTQSGQHTVRIQQCQRLLVQNTHVTGPGKHNSLTIRGDSSWALVQGNFFDQTTAVNPEGLESDEVQRYVIWERNVLDVGRSETPWGMRFIGRDMIVRNNVAYNGSQWHFKAEGPGRIKSANVWFVNNTAFTDKPSAEGVVCEGTGCVSRNNLVYSTAKVKRCFDGGTPSRNWCHSSNECVDPVDGRSRCHPPELLSLDPSSPDFVRPAPAGRGAGAGDPSVPVWNDLHGARRTTMDVGAVATTPP